MNKIIKEGESMVKINQLNVCFQSENIDYVSLSELLIPDYLEMINNRNIMKLLSPKVKTYTYEDELNWVKENLEKNSLIFSMIERKSQNFIGNIELMDVNNKSAEIGIVITESFQGKHYGTEALKTIIDYSFNVLKLRELDLIVYAHNARAIHCYKKLGFKEYKVVNNVAMIDNQSVDDIYMKLEK